MSIFALKDAFFGGVDEFLIGMYSDKVKADLVNRRFEKMVHLYEIGSGPREAS